TWQLIVGAAIIGGWIVLGVAAPLLTNVDPLKSTTLIIDGPRSVLAPYDPGTYGYPLGSDRSGRDLWAGVMYGARATLGIAFIVLAARLVVGTTLGAVAGWFAGSTMDRAVSALIDAFGAFPTVLFAMLWIFAFDIRSGVSAFAAALAITGWWGFGRATRSAVVALLAQGEFQIYRAHWIALVPATALTCAILGFNLVGHGPRTFFERAPVALGKLLTLRTAVAVLAVFVALRLASPYFGPAGSFVAAAREFDAARARAHVDWLSDPSRAGRYTGSAGFNDSARYLAGQLKS